MTYYLSRRTATTNYKAENIPPRSLKIWDSIKSVIGFFTHKETENMLKDAIVRSDIVNEFTVADAEHFIESYLEVYDVEMTFLHKDGQIIMQTKRNHTLH